MRLPGLFCCTVAGQILQASPVLAESGAGGASAHGVGLWVIAASLGVAACLVFLAGQFWFGDSSQRQRARFLRNKLDRMDHPAAVTAINGSIFWANQNALRGHDSAPRTLHELLAPRARIDLGVIYRTGSDAVRLGFGAARVGCCNDDGVCVLVARQEPPASLIWTLVPVRELEISAPSEGADRYDEAPFGYLVVDGDGRATGNACFQNMFDTAKVLRALRDAQPFAQSW